MKNINSNYYLDRMGTPEKVENLICFFRAELFSHTKGDQITLEDIQTHAI